MNKLHERHLASALAHTQIAIDYKHTYGKYPSSCSKTKRGRKAYAALANLRRAKKGASGCRWYPECEQLATKNGCSDMFDVQAIRLNHALANTRKVAEYKSSYGEYPSQIAKSKKIAKLGNWLSNMRQARKGSVSNSWYPECELLVIGLGHTDMFNFDRSTPWIPTAMKHIENIAEYYKKHGVYPRPRTTNNQCSNKVAAMGNWLAGMRAAKAKSCGEYIWRPEYETMATNLGSADMFDRPPKRNISVALQHTRDIAEYKEKYGKYPTSRSENGLALACWLSEMRRAKAGDSSTKVWLSECGQLATELGHPDMFDRKNILRGNEARVEAAAEYYQGHGRYPSTMDSNKHIRQLGNWLSRLRRAKRGCEPTTKWRPECEALAMELGCPDMFERQITYRTK